MSDEPKLPSQGGSYVLTKSGKLQQTAGTIGPLDPEHPEQQAKLPETDKPAEVTPAPKET